MHPSFISQEELFYYVMAYGWTFPLAVIVTFLALYRYSLLRKIKDEIKKRKDLTTIEPNRSNGHHKPKEKV